MASSIDLSALYDASGEEFTQHGILYIRSDYANTPHPTPAQFEQLDKETGYKEEKLPVSKYNLY